MDEWVQYDKTGIEKIYGLEEAIDVFREHEGVVFARMRCGRMIWDEGENFDVGEVGTEGGEELELGGVGVGMRCNDDDAALDGGCAIG